jgi:triosephosphate isomerase
VNTGDNIPDTEEGVDIGPATIAAYAEILRSAKTVLWNGPMGIFEDPRFAEGTFAVARAVADATAKGAKSIIGGGDSVKAINKAKLGDQVTFMSTGGGASLEFLEGKTSPEWPPSRTSKPAGTPPHTHPLSTPETPWTKTAKLIIAGNWKMNKTAAEALDLVNGIKREVASVKEVDIVVCPPFTALAGVSKALLNSNIRLGAQNMSENGPGAFTGEIAAAMLKEFSVRYVILGHSERRQYQKESDELIAKKAAAAHASALKPIVCVGETLAEREGGLDREGHRHPGPRQPRRPHPRTDGGNHRRL